MVSCQANKSCKKLNQKSREGLGSIPRRCTFLPINLQRTLLFDGENWKKQAKKCPTKCDNAQKILYKTLKKPLDRPKNAPKWTKIRTKTCILVHFGVKVLNFNLEFGVEGSVEPCLIQNGGTVKKIGRLRRAIN